MGSPSPRGRLRTSSRSSTAPWSEALKSPEVQKFSNAAGMDARGMSSDDLHNRIKSDVAKWSQVIEKAGIKKR